jgi:hypothetical protein
MRVESQVAVPVEQAQLIDPAAFRFDTSGAQAIQQAGAVITELGKRKADMQDRIAVSNVNAAMNKAQLDYQQEIIGKPLDQHASILQKHVNLAKTSSGNQKMTAEARTLAQNKLNIWGNNFAEIGELSTIKALEKDALIRVTDDYENALTNGTPEDIADAELALDEQYEGSYTPAEAGRLKEQVEGRAVAQMETNAIDGVHAAIEAASAPGSTGDFTIAKELAKSPLIDEKTQSSLRSSIGTAETALDTRQKNAVTAKTNEVTSNTIRDYFTVDPATGNSIMTVPELMKRHEAGFLKDSEFKSMMENLTTTVPKDSDGFAAGRVRRAVADFEEGLISRADVDSAILKEYPLLDGPDRSNVVSDLEAVSSKILGTAKSNAYAEGSSLRSVQFVGIETEDQFTKLFAGSGLTEGQKKRLNRRRLAEINNQDLYERAVSDRLNEMRKSGIEDVNKYKSESLSILLQYQNRLNLKLGTTKHCSVRRPSCSKTKKYHRDVKGRETSRT